MTSIHCFHACVNTTLSDVSTGKETVDTCCYCWQWQFDEIGNVLSTLHKPQFICNQGDQIVWFTFIWATFESCFAFCEKNDIASKISDWVIFYKSIFIHFHKNKQFQNMVFLSSKRGLDFQWFGLSNWAFDIFLAAQWLVWLLFTKKWTLFPHHLVTLL